MTVQGVPPRLQPDLPGPDIAQAGVYIGLLERFLTLVFLLGGQYSAVGFIFAAKSIARYRELENRDFAEYYLVGTLLSLSLAVVGYLLLQALGAGMFR